MVFVTGPSYAEDTAHTTGDEGPVLMTVRQDGEGSLSSASGDYTPLQVDRFNRLKVATDHMRTAFGEGAHAEKTPQLQYSFPSHIDPEEWSVATNPLTGVI